MSSEVVRSIDRRLDLYGHKRQQQHVVSSTDAGFIRLFYSSKIAHLNNVMVDAKNDVLTSGPQCDQIVWFEFCQSLQHEIDPEHKKVTQKLPIICQIVNKPQNISCPTEKK